MAYHIAGWGGVLNAPSNLHVYKYGDIGLAEKYVLEAGNWCHDSQHLCIIRVKGGWHNEAMRNENMGMHPPYAQTFEESVCSYELPSKIASVKVCKKRKMQRARFFRCVIKLKMFNIWLDLGNRATMRNKENVAGTSWSCVLRVGIKPFVKIAVRTLLTFFLDICNLHTWPTQKDAGHRRNW